MDSAFEYKDRLAPLVFEVSFRFTLSGAFNIYICIWYLYLNFEIYF